MKALVTGGGGFLGKAIAKALVARGDEVRSFSRGAYPELAELGIDHIRGELADAKAVAEAAAGQDVVFHTAALAGIWGAYERYHEANVVGTQNVIAACREHAIPKLVYTSSPSAVYGGGDQEGVDESEPYPEKHLAFYGQTKAAAERLVVAADGPELSTVSLRPHLIWGPGDNHVIPRIVARARAGKLRKLGKDDRLIDTIYIDNAAEAHLLACEALAPGSAVAGQVYFLSQGEPRPCWELINAFLKAADAPPVTKSIPVPLAFAAGAVLEGIYKLLGKNEEPPMTRFLARQMSTAHWFDISAAKRDFGYQARVSIDEGLERLAEAYASGLMKG